MTETTNQKILKLWRLGLPLWEIKKECPTTYGEILNIIKHAETKISTRTGRPVRKYKKKSSVHKSSDKNNARGAKRKKVSNKQA